MEAIIIWFAVTANRGPGVVITWQSGSAPQQCLGREFSGLDDGGLTAYGQSDLERCHLCFPFWGGSRQGISRLHTFLRITDYLLCQVWKWYLPLVSTSCRHVVLGHLGEGAPAPETEKFGSKAFGFGLQCNGLDASQDGAIQVSAWGIHRLMGKDQIHGCSHGVSLVPLQVCT